jgi:cytochrome oxidase Cu insertion factor (SCO1/SenC/PrrC family)
MTETNNNPVIGKNESAVPERTNSILWIGSIVWVLCLAGIIFGWYQWRLNYLARSETRVSNPATENQAEVDGGRSGKTIKLVPQKDGTFLPREVTKEQDENPWDPAGIEDFSFIDTDGQTVTKADLIGKPFVISFIFTLCRGPCPNVSREMREIQDRLKDYDLNLVSLTVDPQRDTADVLKTYGRELGADFSRWKFLTGPQSEIYGLIHRSFLMPVQEEEDRDRKPGFEIIHSTNIMLVDKTGRVIGKFNAQKGEEMARLRKEIKQVATLRTVQKTTE